MEMKHLKKFEDINESVIPELLNANPNAKEIWNKALDFCKDLIEKENNAVTSFNPNIYFKLDQIKKEIVKYKIV